MDTDIDLETRLVAAARTAVKRVPTDIAQEILRVVASIEYGSVEVVIHEGKVMQIECREKIRVSQTGLGRKASKS
ncbi:MAG: YezD family protein [Nitrosomonas sp.]|nr:YezD family protein [Nitrosomonas sp.]MDP1949603.1 YezD family protein [Nitrosomonas sp.]